MDDTQEVVKGTRHIGIRLRRRRGQKLGNPAGIRAHRIVGRVGEVDMNDVRLPALFPSRFHPSPEIVRRGEVLVPGIHDVPNVADVGNV